MAGSRDRAPGVKSMSGSVEQSHPNLVIVYPDQMRGQAMGFVGKEPVYTPNLDRFASESFVAAEAVANYPVCSPSRAMLMTGLYPPHNRVLTNCHNRSAPYDVQLAEDSRCWSDVLAGKGYSLGYIGKWHLDAPREPYIDCANNRGELKWNEWCPPSRRHGFGFWYAYGTYDYHTRPMYWHGDAAREEFHYVDQWGPEHEADLAIEYIRNARGTKGDMEKPFALVVGMNPPHMPYELVPEHYVDLYADVDLADLCAHPGIPPAETKWGDYYRAHIRNYYAMISGVDEQFGRILAALDEQGLTENTIVLFTSDHGDCLGIHGMQSKNNAYEESMRVPFLARWPSRIVSQRGDLLLSTPDIAPTLLELMGFGTEIPRQVEGTSYAQILMGKEMPRPTSQPYFWIPCDQPALGRRGVRTRTHTYVETREPGKPVARVLYDRAQDPFQLDGISVEDPAAVQDCVDELTRWLEIAGDPWLSVDEHSSDLGSHA